jgi:hypothetical protein
MEFLALQEFDFLKTVLEKHGLLESNYCSIGSFNSERIARECISSSSATADQLHNIIDEVLRTQRDLRSRIDPRYRYDERWADFVRCLELDGYRVEEQTLRTVDPTIEHSQPLEDDLTCEINKSHLPETTGILDVLKKSADAYRRPTPDYNACLSDARVALQTLATGIARQRRGEGSSQFDECKWGQVLAFLRISGFLDKKEEDTLAGVFGFVSDGSHIPVGLTEQEMVRLGRTLIVGMCFFLVKRYNSL